MKTRPLVFFVPLLFACAGDRRFPLRDPLWRDTDLASVTVRCHKEPTSKDPHHISCAPKMYASPLVWDGLDNIFFRPLSESLGVVTSGEAIDVNSLDEVPDSAWFENRIGRHALTAEEIHAGACSVDQILDPDSAPDGSWKIDDGKTDGSSGGFRIRVPKKGKFLIKLDELDNQPERQSAAAVIGMAVMHAAGYRTSCEQIVYIRRSLLALTPGLKTRANFGPTIPFDEKALDKLLKNAVKRGDRYRTSASAWMDGHVLGPYRYEGTREDDPNDVIPHENRRELRAMRLIAAWLNRYDGREANSLDSWYADDAKRPESSPGHVIHYQLDTSETLGGDWGRTGSLGEFSKRLGWSYALDWGDIGRDFITLGIQTRPWDRVHDTVGHELFGHYSLRDFVADEWKNEYPNPAFSRMTERDGAWMARILAHFTRENVRSLAEIGDFTKRENTDYLASVLEGRLEIILE